MNPFKYTKKAMLKKTHSNRRESIYWENKLKDSINQWEDLKKEHQDKIQKEQYEIELAKRENEVKNEKQKLYKETLAQKEAQSEQELQKRLEIDEKIRNKKKLEIKKRDIIFRNKSKLG